MTQSESAAFQSEYKQRFIALWKRNAGTAAAGIAERSWSCLITHFSEAHRYYHDGKHMRHCLRELDGAAHEIGNPDVVEMALWFHDAIYDPGAADNEAQSARLFESFAEPALNPNFTREVREAILDTVHQALPESGNARFVVDIDLSSFGLPWQEFMADSHALRKEQMHLSDPEFYQRKCAFLKTLIDRDRIYATRYFHDLYELAARTNIERYLRVMLR